MYILKETAECTKEQQKQLLIARNHPDIRRFMNRTGIITEKEHDGYMSMIRDDKSIMHLCLLDSKGVVVGSGSLSSIDIKENICQWGLFVSPGLEPGLGKSLAMAILKIAFMMFHMKRVNASIVDTNTRSARFHHILGFKPTGAKNPGGYLGVGAITHYLTKESAMNSMADMDVRTLPTISIDKALFIKRYIRQVNT